MSNLASYYTQRGDVTKGIVLEEECWEKKKALTKEEKTVIKEAKDKMEAPYGTVILDTHTEKNGNFRVEPAGLFRSASLNPKSSQKYSL